MICSAMLCNSLIALSLSSYCFFKVFRRLSSNFCEYIDVDCPISVPIAYSSIFLSLSNDAGNDDIRMRNGQSFGGCGSLMVNVLVKRMNHQERLSVLYLDMLVLLTCVYF